MIGDDMGKDDLLLLEDLIQMLPMVDEATAMAEELNKGVKFEVTNISPQARGLKSGKTEVMVKMVALDGSGNSWLWDCNKFINRKFIMQEMYQNYVEGNASWDVPQDKDPFWEPVDTEQLIGTTHVLLQSLAFKIGLSEYLTISDCKGQDQGHLTVSIIPCTQTWDSVGEDDFVEDPNELKGKPMYCKLEIKSARGLPHNIDKSFCQYKWYLDDKYTKTEEIAGTINPDYHHEKKLTVNSATEQFIKYLEYESLYIEVWGRQKGKGEASKPPKTADGSKKPAGKKDAVLPPQRNGTPGALPPIQDNTKLKEGANMYKKNAGEHEQKRSNTNDYIRKRKGMGHTAMTMEDVEALLEGRTPPGRPVNTGSGSAANVQESKACVIL